MSQFIRLIIAAVIGLVATTNGGQNPRPAEASAVLALADRSLAEIEPGLLRDYATTQLVRARLLTGDFDRALTLASAIGRSEEKDEALVDIVRAQVSIDARAARRACQGISGPDRRGLAQGILALHEATSGDVDAGLRFAAAIEDEGWRFTTVAAIATELFRKGRSVEAETLLSGSPAIQSVLKTWRLEAAAQGLEGLGRSMFDARLVGYLLRQKAVSHSIDLEDLYQSIYGYAYSIEEAMQLGELAGLKEMVGDREQSSSLENAFLKALERLESTGEEIDMPTAQFAVGMALVGDPDGAMRVALRCRGDGARSIVYLGIVTSQAEEGDLARAVAALRLITVQPARLGALAELARILAPKRPSEALSYVRQAEAELSHADPQDPRHYYLVSMASAYADLSRPADALRTLAALEKTFGNDFSVEPRELAELYLRAGDVGAARRWAGIDVQSFGTILERQTACGDVRGASETAKIAHRAMRAAIGKNGPGEEIVAVCRAEARLLDPSAALAWANTLENPEAKVYALAGIAEGISERPRR